MRPEAWSEQLRRALAITRKDILIYYFKGPVLIFGIFMPLFLFLAFYIGNRTLPLPFLVSGLLAMTLFFTATAVSPVIFPWEGQARTLERLVSAPIAPAALIVGDMLASFLFGVGISVVPIGIGLALGVGILHPLLLVPGIVLGAFCFSALGLIFAVPPTNAPSNIMMLTTLVKFPLVFISGIFIPVEQLPFWGRVLAMLSPLTYCTDLARYAFAGRNAFPVAADLAALAGLSLLFLAAAIALHKRTLPRRL